MAEREPLNPRSLGTVLSELFSARGYVQAQTRYTLEEIWKQVVGEPYYSQTCIGNMRRGVLEIIVGHPALLQELSAFRKTELLRKLQQNEAGLAIRDLRFRVGPIGTATKSPRTVTPRPDRPEKT